MGWNSQGALNFLKDRDLRREKEKERALERENALFALTLESMKAQNKYQTGEKYTAAIDANKILREVIGDGNVVNKEQRHEVKHAHPTWTKSVKILEYKEVTDLRTGLEKMWKWAKEQPNRNRFVWDTYEIEKGIYNYWKQKK